MTDVRKLQLVEKELLKVAVDICEKEHLRYYIIGGTLLGAVRHKGYIPWDDDTDVAMPREDYDRFLQAAESYLSDHGGYKLETYEKTAGYFRYFSRVTDRHVKMRFVTSTEGLLENVWVDIFPLDGMPDGKFASKIHALHMLYHRAMYMFSIFSKFEHPKRSGRPWYEKFLIWVGYHFPVEKFLEPYKRLMLMDKAMRKYPTVSSNVWINFMSSYKMKEMFPREVFGEGRLYEFEGMMLKGPQDAETYLTQVYGDYMSPPPISERGGHCVEIIESESGYLDKLFGGEQCHRNVAGGGTPT